MAWRIIDATHAGRLVICTQVKRRMSHPAAISVGSRSRSRLELPAVPPVGVPAVALQHNPVDVDGEVDLVAGHPAVELGRGQAVVTQQPGHAQLEHAVRRTVVDGPCVHRVPERANPVAAATSMALQHTGDGVTGHQAVEQELLECADHCLGGDLAEVDQDSQRVRRRYAGSPHRPEIAEVGRAYGRRPTGSRASGGGW